MMLLQVIFLLLVAIAAGYCLTVCVCVAGRMTPQTRHLIRWPVVLLGSLAFWAILRTIMGDWSLSLPDVSHAVSVVIGAGVLAMLPRLST